jgi:hypothetical protein
VNARRHNEAFGSLKVNWNGEHGRKKDAYVPWIGDFEKALNARHSAISGLLCSGIGTRLQYIDGKMIRKVCVRLCEMGICALPVHDSVIVQDKYSNVCERIMVEEYEKAVGHQGFSCKIKKKRK